METTELLYQWRTLIESCASRLTRCPDMKDDLIQVGQICCWRLHESGYDGCIAIQVRREMVGYFLRQIVPTVTAADPVTGRKPGPFELRCRIAEAERLLSGLGFMLLRRALNASKQGAVAVRPNARAALLNVPVKKFRRGREEVFAALSATGVL